MRFAVLTVLLGMLLLGSGCRWHQAATDPKSEVAAQQMPKPTASPDGEDPFTQGFTITRPAKCDCPDDGKSWTDSTWPFAYYDASGKQIGNSAFALDRGETEEGDVVFKWPAKDEKIDRDYDRLAELMVEYSELVGTCLSRPAEGFGEEEWSRWIRTEQYVLTELARRDGSEKWCREVVNQLVDRYVPSGSTYRQYGNCGEGGRIGACLAKRAGFKDEEIRLCLSKNDHFFAMVYRGESNGVDHKWCILDRWDLIGNFNCEVAIDFAKQVITHKGEPADQKWFQRVNCTTLDKFIEDPHEHLYDF